MPLEKESLNNFLPDGFETNNLEGAKENFSADKIATGYEKDVKDRVSGPNFNNLLDVIGKNTNVLTKFMDFIKNMPVNNLFAVDENNQLVYKNLDEVGGGGLEIGDIGIAPLGIDESKGKRRYLNGQILIQEQYQTFTAKLKEAIALYPTLACSESDWQATALLTVGGQVGKFVVDDDAGTIRLPKIIMPIQGLTNLSKLAEIVEAGLPNITGGVSVCSNSDKQRTPNCQGAFYIDTISSTSGYNIDTYDTTQATTKAVALQASRSNPTYGNSNTVQQEQIQYPYFIQVATGAETEDNIINEIELNNPFFFGMSQYFESEPNNISWLKSAGQYNSKAIYPAYYDWLLKIYNGTETVEGVSVKLSTEEYTDYDFVLNTAEETFRLPLLDGSEDLVSEKYIDVTLETSGTEYTAPVNGWLMCRKTAGSSSGTNHLTLVNTSNEMAMEVTANNSTDQLKLCLPVKKDDIIQCNYSGNGTTHYFRFIYAQGNGSLYYYVGETVQNANLINAGRIEEKLVDKADTNASNFTADGKSLIANFGLPSEEYIDIAIGANDATYIMSADGYLAIYSASPNTSEGGNVGLKNLTLGNFAVDSLNIWGRRKSCFLPVRKNDKVMVTHGGHVISLRLYLLQGNKGEL